MPVSGAKTTVASEKTNKLFPHFLLRVAGMPITQMQRMRATHTIHILNKMTEKSRQLMENTSSIIEQIEQEVPSLSSDQLRNQLIAYKRDLYNGRFPKWRAEHFKQELPTYLIHAMKDWEKEWEEIRSLKESAQSVFDQEQIASRRLLQQLISHPNLLNGIALTSQDLYSKALKYMNTPVEEQKARLRKVEYSLSKFVSRAVAKTSPFSTFTSVGLGNWNEHEEEKKFILSSVQYDSHIQINHANILRILEGIMSYPEVKRSLRYKVNASLIVDEQRVKYIRRIDDSRLRPRVFKTLETPVSLDYSRAIELVFQQFQSAPHQELPYPELIKKLLERSQFQEAQLHSFLDQLISLQILVPQMERFEQSHDLLERVIKWLEPFKSEALVETRQCLKQVYKDVENFRTASINERLQLLGQIKKSLQRICHLIGVEISLESLNLVIFEDAILQAESQSSIQTWKPALEDLATYQKLVPIFDTKFRMQSAIAHKFIELYGVDGICDKPGQFLSRVITAITDYFQSMSPYSMLKEMEIHNEIENVRILNELKREFGQLLISKLADGVEEIEITCEEIESLTARIPEAVQRRMITNDFFVQVAKQSNRERIVINHMYVGNGTFYSRFLPYFHEGIVESLQSYLQSLVPAGILAEVSPVFGFNANLHPSLAPYELTLPMLPATRENLPSKAQIPWDEMMLTYDSTKDQVIFTHPEHGEVSIFFAGTLTPAMLPFVINYMTTHFTNGNMPENLHLFAEQQLSKEERNQVRSYPRICVGNVVIARKRWLVPKHYLPTKENKESDYEYFCKVHRWRTELGLPKHVFIRFTPLEDHENPFQNAEGESNTGVKIDFTDWKPQWIDFENPVLVRLLGKMITDSSTGMLVEEMLPNPEEISLEIDGETWVNELVIELSQVLEEE